ncbi:Bromodomain-containing protein, partial [Hyaloraphidium curvatum]
LLTCVNRHDPYGFFWYPVDPAQVPDYARVIAKPMDLETMSKKIDSKAYADIFEFRSDVQLLLDNCRTFNPPNSTYHKAASKLEA